MATAKQTKNFKTAFDTYRHVKQLGSGGSGTVHQVENSERLQLAVKVLDPTKVTSKALKRFQNEVHFCSSQNHRNIIQILDHGLTEEGSPFCVMPLYSGTLRAILSKGVAPTDVLRLYGQILDGVEAAHLQGACHRDLKPENILFDDKTGALVIADFGIASFKEEDLYTAVETSARDRLANFIYAAPEQRVRGMAVDNRADIYALGLILNEFFTNAVPQGTGFRQIGTVSPDFAYLDDLVHFMLQQEPEKRPVTVQVIKEQLIARKNEFISLQRISSLKKQVVPETELDDPLVGAPVELVGADYQNGSLFLRLSGTPNVNWIECFKNPSSFSHVLGVCHPVMFAFNGQTATIGAEERSVQTIIDNFKHYLTLATASYKTRLEQARRKELEHKRQELARQVQEEEKRQRILKSIKI